MISLEVCANSITSALAAQQGGATRIELCTNLHEGGTTPSAGQILTARKLLNIQLYVLIRPRGSDFLYSDAEFETMLADVKFCIEAGCDGIVTGILKADGSVDKDRCIQLLQLAKSAGLGATFHRAFDMCADYSAAMEDIIDIGFERILTSGGKNTAMEGASAINQLVKQAAGRISIMAGSGVNEQNVVDLIKATGVKEIHGTLLSKIKSKMQYQNDNALMSNDNDDEFTYEATSAERVRSIIELMNPLSS
jgi:copper homeostasis protein